MQSTDFVVVRNDLQQCKVIETQLPDTAALPDEALLVKVTRFAFTANNITYAVLGDHLKYWQLFPAPPGFGNVPVWGFGKVITSKHPGIAEDEILFGYFPMSTHLVLEAADVSKRGLRDAAAHRQGAAPVYNAYARVSARPGLPASGHHQALPRPLSMLSFLVDDLLAENEFYGAKSVMLSSASSKTAYGLAHLLHARGNGIKTIGLTATGNAPFVKSLGCYDEVVTYDNVSSLPTNSSVAYVDMAGNSPLRAMLHRHFGEQMRYSGIIGLTHRKSSPDEPKGTCRVPPKFSSRPTRSASARMSGDRAESIGALGPPGGFAPARSLAQDQRSARAGRGARAYLDTLRPRSAGTGSYPVAVGIGGISSRPFCGLPNGYRVG
jgi:hypothetical protein